MSMGAFEYSYESRSYGICYGLAMLAFSCWTRAVDLTGTARTRGIALAGLIFALAAGISTNYFAVLAFFPVAAGEAVRTVSEMRRMKQASEGQCLWRALYLRVWFAMAIAASPLIAYLPFIRRSIAEFGPYAWNKVSMRQVTDSYTQMVEGVLYPILALFVFGIGVRLTAWWLSKLCPACRARVVPKRLSPLLIERRPKLSIPAHEAVAVFCLMAYPFIGYVVASVRGGMLSPRFVIPVCYGLAIAATLMGFQTFRSSRRAGLVFVCFMMAWFCCRESYVGYYYEEQKQCFYKVLDHLPQAEREAPANAPIVIPDPLLVLTFEHYAPRTLARRVVFPVDFPAIRRFRGDDSPEQNLWAGRNFIYKFPIEPVGAFQQATSDYLIIAEDGNWFLRDLEDHNYPVQRLPINTRAAAMGGFTPLARGTPVFYTASWGDDATLLPLPSLPVPFRAADNLPTPQSSKARGAGQ